MQEIVVQHGLFRWIQKLAPVFPVPHLPLSCHGKSPTLSSGRPNKSQCPEFMLHLKPEYFRVLTVCCGPQQLLDPGSPCSRVRKQANAWGECIVRLRKGVGRASLFPWDYISLGFRWARCFFHRVNFLDFCRLLIGPPSSQTDRPLWSSTLPCAILIATVHVPACPCSFWQSGSGREKGAMLILLMEECSGSRSVKSCTFLVKHTGLCSPVY